MYGCKAVPRVRIPPSPPWIRQAHLRWGWRIHSDSGFEKSGFYKVKNLLWLFEAINNGGVALGETWNDCKELKVRRGWPNPSLSAMDSASSPAVRLADPWQRVGWEPSGENPDYINLSFRRKRIDRECIAKRPCLPLRHPSLKLRNGMPICSKAKDEHAVYVLRIHLIELKITYFLVRIYK